VDRIVFCFSEAVGNSAYSEGRKHVLRNFPHKQVSTLDITEGDVFDLADWKHPQPSVDGLEFRRTERASGREAVYMQNFGDLCGRLREVLKGYRNVITHNPWGEYGHEEHVQIYRAEERAGSSALTWMSNYCGNRSFRLMSRISDLFGLRYSTCDKEFAAEVQDLYKRHVMDVV
jgi:hypothetical protein